MSKVYFIADLHLGHKGICRFRPEFKSVEEHDKFIVSNILKVCGKRDSLYLLGDCFFTEESLDHLREISKKVGSIHLVLGNHDTEDGKKRGYVKTMLVEGLINSIHSLVSYKGCWLSHAPIHSEELRGKLCVHGHTHAEVIEDARYFGVSCEQINYTPIDFQRIKEALNER